MPIVDQQARRKYAREWVAKRRATFFADKRCARCGSNDELVLHHRDPTTKVSHSIWSWSQERREIEIAKCDILCESCHVGYHAKERSLGHGHESAYRRGCRCDICRKAHTERCRKGRRRATERIQKS